MSLPVVLSHKPVGALMKTALSCFRRDREEMSEAKGGLPAGEGLRSTQA